MNKPLEKTHRFEKGKTYTFTFSSGKTVNLWTDNGVKKALREKLNYYADILFVDRALLSGNYVVKMVARKALTRNVWETAFSGAWLGIGFYDADFIEAREGEESGKPGGIVEALPNVGASIGKTVAKTIEGTAAPLAGSIGQTVAAAIKPLALYLIPVVAFFIYLEYRKRA